MEGSTVGDCNGQGANLFGELALVKVRLDLEEVDVVDSQLENEVVDGGHVAAG